jgi:hypothetical protein
LELVQQGYQLALGNHWGLYYLEMGLLFLVVDQK